MSKGERIKELRRKKGMSQSELAQYLNTTKQTISKYEKGIVTNIPSDKIEAMSVLFNISPEYILGWNEEVNKEIKKNPTKMAQIHIEMVEDIDLTDLFQDFKLLDARERKIVKDLAHSLAETKKAEV